MKQPSWMAEPCPPWCVREHEDDDHPDDRRHQSHAVEVAMIVASEPIPGSEPAPLVLVVLLDRPVDGAETWVRIEAAEAAEPRIAVRADDAVRLARAILQATEESG